MAVKLPYADHLINDEVDYELTIRGKIEETKNDVEAKYRMLRYLFKEDEKEGRVYESPFTVDQEYDFICSRIRELRSKLANGLDDRTLSRLKHYWGRVYRIMPKDSESERMRRELLKDIRTELSKFEGRKEFEKRPDPFNFEGEDNLKPNGTKRKELDKSLSQEETQVEVSEREKELEAQVKELQQKLEILLNESKGAKGGTEDIRKENENLFVVDDGSKGYEGSVKRKENENRQELLERDSRSSIGGRSTKQNEFSRNNALRNEVNDRCRSKQERDSYYQRESRPYKTSLGNDTRRDSRFHENEGYDSYDRQRERLTYGRFGDERFERKLGSCSMHRTRQMQHEESQTQYEEREPRRDAELYRREMSWNRDGYRNQQVTDDGRHERFGHPNETVREQQQRDVHRHSDQRWSDGSEWWNVNRHRDEQVRPSTRREARDQLEFSSDEFSEDEIRFTRRQREPRRNFRRISEGEIRDADRRMEKWHVSFSGDARSRSLEDFLLKVRRLARMDRIADDVLMQRIHTILRGEAYDWYLCYADEFHDWEQFEERIRYMYGNPNKDQGNRQKIYERKQNRNETFLSFKMDIERLNKLLSTPLDPQRIFEVIWDNMRPHYRSKLACKTVDSLRKLEYYAYRIDANDPIFRNAREGPSKANAVHNIEVEQKEDESYSSDSETENLNALGSKFERDKRNREQRSAGSNGKWQGASARDTPGSTQLPLCWNCRKNGHLWRNCPEEKRLFCYLCGTQGKTVTTCENHSGDARPQTRDNSGN